jgi:hypothetical protein
VLTWKFIVLNTYIRKEKKSKINNLHHHLRKLEKGEKIKPKINGKKEKIKL